VLRLDDAAAPLNLEFGMPSPSSPRRVFLLQAVAGSSLIATGALQAQTRVEEADENAAALGYKHDSSKIDGKKYPAHQAAQKCNNCQFWQGSATDAWAGCSMFGRKQIAAAGWCLAYKKV
jgi:hypothetical protein